MRRFAIKSSVLIGMASLLLLLGGCGSDPNSKGVVVKVADIKITPVSVSMNKGDVVQLTSTPVDSGGTAVAADVTYASSDSTSANAISVSTSGNLCAGKWDTNFIVCTPDTGSGFADITVKSQDISKTIRVFVHDRVDSVQVDPFPGCVSMGDTAQLTASAFSKDATVCTGLGTTPPCKLPAAQIGAFTWSATSTNVVSIDSSTASNGLATALAPGQTPFFASVARTNSPSATFVTCAITSIDIIVSGSNAAPFTFNKAETKTLAATVKDSAGKTLDGSKLNSSNVATNNPPIQWVSTKSIAATAVGATILNSATATAANPGPTTLVATCTPPTCNPGLAPVFSNPIVATVSGTSLGTVYAGSTSSLTLIPIESSTNTPGTAITLPRLPNSMVANNTGTKLLLGADTGGVMLVDTATNVVTTSSLVGKVIGMSTDGVHAFVFDSTNSAVFIMDVTAGTLSNAIIVTGTPTAADTTPDGKITFTVSGNTLYSFDTASGQKTTPLSGTAKDLAVLANGAAVYVPLAAGTVETHSTCNLATVVDSSPATAPSFVEAIPSGDGAVAVDSPNLVVINNAHPGSGCPLSLTQTTSSVDLQGGAFTARQLLVTPDSTNVFVTNSTGKLLSYNLKTGTPTPIALAGGTDSFGIASLLDGSTVYVGGGDGAIHRITTSGTPADAQQISVGLKKSDGSTAVPDLVVVRNHS